MFSSKLLQCFNLVDSFLGLHCGRRSTACANQPPLALYPVHHQLAIVSCFTHLGKTILPDEELVWKEALSNHTKEEPFHSEPLKICKQACTPDDLRNLRIQNRPNQTRPHTFSLQLQEGFFHCVVLPATFQHLFFNPNLAPGPVKLWKLSNPCLHNLRRHLPPGRSVALPDRIFRGLVDTAWGASVFKEPSDRKDL